MGYGFSIGNIRATSDMSRVFTKASANGNGYFPFKTKPGNANYQVPSGKKALTGILRITDRNNLSGEIGYADDVSGTNYNGIAGIVDMDMWTAPSERYWVFEIPATKYPLFKAYSAGSSPLITFYIYFVEVSA